MEVILEDIFTLVEVILEDIFTLVEVILEINQYHKGSNIRGFRKLF